MFKSREYRHGLVSGLLIGSGIALIIGSGSVTACVILILCMLFSPFLD